MKRIAAFLLALLLALPVSGPAQISGDLECDAGSGQCVPTSTLKGTAPDPYLLSLLGLSAQDLNNLFVGARVSGAGVNRIITITQANGSTFALPVPDTTGGGGVGGSADGVVSSAAFTADGSTLTLTLSTGETVSTNVPAALRYITLTSRDVESSSTLSYPVYIASNFNAGNISAGTVMRGPSSGANEQFLVRMPDADADLHSVMDRLVGGELFVRVSGGASDGNMDGGTILSVQSRASAHLFTVRLSVDEVVGFGSNVNIRFTSPFLTRAGGTLTGPLTLPGPPTEDNQAATKKYVDDNAGGTIANNSITAAQARATSTAHRREWQTRLGIPDDWSEIPQGTPLTIGKVVEHGGAYFAALASHNRSGTGPDGDPTNWVLLSNYRGDWVAAWYPVGSFVRRGGLPWVAAQAVTINDPAPDANTNTKWLQLGSLPTAVVIASSNTTIPASANGNTYVHTGSSNITYTLPAASGGSAVANGWEVVISNQGAGDLTIDGAGADTVDGSATLVISTNGRAVRLQKTANSVWVSIADTATGSGTADLPTVVNISADTAIPSTAHGDTYRVTGTTARTITLPDPDDISVGFFVRVANGSTSVSHSIARQGTGQSIEGGNGPITVASGEVLTLQLVNTNEWELITDTTKGGGGTIADNSILPIKAQAGTPAQQKGWRERLASSSIGLVASALPAVANHNTGDTLIIGRGGTTVVPFREVDTPATELTTTVSGDVMMLLAAGWSRVGNLFSGGVAAAAARAIADANKANLDRRSVFEHYALSPAGISGLEPPDLIVLRLSGKRINKIITNITVSIEGVVMANVNRIAVPVPPVTDPLLSFNESSATYEQSGGIINLTFVNESTKQSFRQAIFVAQDNGFVEGTIRYTFSDGTSAFDHVEWGIDSPAYSALSVHVVSNIASYDATQNLFEDSSGNPIRVSDGSIVTLTQAIYDAAVADSDFTVNSTAIFLTPTNLYFGGNRYARGAGGSGGTTDQTARDAAAAAQTTADAATTPAEATAIANARAAVTPGPALIISNIASFDATQDRFEDSSGNAVTVPNGSIATLTQAVYNAAVADAQFTPNANAIFLTR